jgi:hypothetical protein
MRVPVLTQSRDRCSGRALFVILDSGHMHVSILSFQLALPFTYITNGDSSGPLHR